MGSYESPDKGLTIAIVRAGPGFELIVTLISGALRVNISIQHTSHDHLVTEARHWLDRMRGDGQCRADTSEVALAAISPPP